MRTRSARSFTLPTTLLALLTASIGVAAPPTAPKPTAPPATPSAVAPRMDASAAPSASKAPSSSLRPHLKIERFTLENGLRVVINPDPTSPTVAVTVWYDVGSRNEKPGEGGFAHLFEHMMFEGSAGVPRGEHEAIVSARGGKQNASTSEDWTDYWELMPSTELPVTLFLEAARMRALDVTDVAFQNQRKVVQEEYRLRVANAPYVNGYFRLLELVYDGYQPYSHPAIGSMKELDAAKTEWVRAFHDKHYAPNGAVLVIAGDVDVTEATKLVHRYFDSIGKKPLEAYDPPKFVPRTTATGPEPVSDPFAKTALTYLGWSIPKDGDPDHYALEIAAEVLAGGESARLQQKLVRDRGWLQSIDVSAAGHRGPDLFDVEAHLAECAVKMTVDTKTHQPICSQPVKSEEVDRAILAEIDELAAHGPTAAELQKARAQIEHGFLFGLQSNLSRAISLAQFEGERGDASLLTSEVDRYVAVTADDVRKAVKKYLTRSTMSEVRVLPLPKESAPPPASAAPKAAPSASAGGSK